MPQAVITTDKRWYAIDVYVRRGSELVKQGATAQFLATPEKAAEVRGDVAAANPQAALVCNVYDDRTMRWTPWR
jgi:hypothetical protein